MPLPTTSIDLAVHHSADSSAATVTDCRTPAGLFDPLAVRRRLLWVRRSIFAVLAAVLIWQAPLWAQLTLLPLLAAVAIWGTPQPLESVGGLNRFLALDSSGALGLFLSLDGLLLLLCVAVTGGGANPLICTLLIYVVLAALLLPLRLAAAYAFAASCGYTLLLYFLPGDSAHGVDRWHLVGMWLNFCGSAALLTAVVWPLADALRTRERQLARARETALRDEQVIAVGTLAASTMHALATPLATMQLLLEEWELEGDTRVRALHEPLARCRVGLETLRRAGDARTPLPLAEVIARLRDHYRLAPDPKLSFSGQPPPQAQVAGDAGLPFALINLIDNALAAATRRVAIDWSLRAGAVELTLDDDGPGMSAELRQRFGSSPLASQTGLGIGGLLANATIERLGGQVMIDDSAGGTRLTVRLPALSSAP